MGFKRKATSLSLIICGIGLLIGTACGQMPKILNGKVETQSSTGNLQGQFRSIDQARTSAAWIGYSVPTIASKHSMCCQDSISEYEGNGNCGTCRLEHDGDKTYTDSKPSAESGTIKLESLATINVLYRAENGKIGRIRTFSANCTLDAGGLPVIWLTGVSPSDSVAFLSSFVVQGSWERTNDDSEDSNSLASSAIAAIALTNDSSADLALDGFVAPSQPEWLREHTVFWLGAARGHSGFEMLEKLARNDSDERLRDKVTFALYVSHDPAAVDEIIRMAKDDASERVRGQALFWLAQEASRKAIGAISSAVENDPDTQVKKRAVFALSQLPSDQGVPLLIQVAKTNPNEAVRKQAMFWLGQSRDPRALGFFEQILSQ